MRVIEGGGEAVVGAALNAARTSNSSWLQHCCAMPGRIQCDPYSRIVASIKSPARGARCPLYKRGRFNGKIIARTNIYAMPST